VIASSEQAGMDAVEKSVPPDRHHCDAPSTTCFIGLHVREALNTSIAL